MDGNGIVNISDLTLLKRGIAKGFADTKAQKAADFNLDGKVTNDDAKMLVLFLSAQM